MRTCRHEALTLLVQRVLTCIRRTGFATMLAGSLAFPITNLAAQSGLPPNAEELLSSQIQDAEQVRSRIRDSKMSPEQIRSRLRAAGYPEGLLDSYLAGAVGASGSVAAPRPTPDVLAAVRVLSEGEERARSGASASGGTGWVPTAEPTVDGLPLFGYRLFARPSSEFEPSLAGPVDDSYRLGVQDIVAVILTGATELSHSLEVTRDGFIVIPQVGQVFLANLTLGQAREVILARLRKAYSSLGEKGDGATKMYVTVSRIRTNQVFVIGDVSRPGSYQLSAASTVLTALYAAGGPAIDGSLRAVEVMRGGRRISEIDLYKYLRDGDASGDVRLENGDIVFIPRHLARVAAVGQLLTNAWFELKPGETLADVVRFAGGFTAEASTTRFQIARILPASERSSGGNDRTLIDVFLNGGATGGAVPSTSLHDGDRITVFSVTSRVRNQITVSGGVWSPGPQGLAAGTRISDAIKRAGGFQPDAFLDEVYVSRRLSDDRRVLLRLSFDTKSLLAKEDLVLEGDDEILVYRKADLRAQRTVRVSGAVRTPKAIEWFPGLTLRALLLAAGGLADGASLVEVEVARLPATRSAGVVATTMRLPLDSSYLFDKDPNGTYYGVPGTPTLAQRTAEFQLQPYDQVMVFFEEDFELPATVSIGGEVRAPGNYTLRSRTETIRDLVARAGGLTERAYPNGAIFERRVSDADLSIQKQLVDRVARDFQVALEIGRSRAREEAISGVARSSGESPSVSVREALSSDIQQWQRVELDLPKVMSNPRHAQNFVVRAGDRITIPPYVPTVSVKGFVGAQVGVTYTAGRPLTYYVDAAGGATSSADVSHAFVMQPNGRVQAYKRRFLLPDKDPAPLAGATVVVPPADPSKKRSDWGQVLGVTSQVLAAVVALVVVTR